MKHYSLGNRQCYRAGGKDLGLGGFTQGTQVCIEVLRENRRNTFYIRMLGVNKCFLYVQQHPNNSKHISNG